MDLARAPRRAPLTARKRGSGYENELQLTTGEMGNFIQFHEQEINGEKIPSWSNWLDNVYTDDVVIL